MLLCCLFPSIAPLRLRKTLSVVKDQYDRSGDRSYKRHAPFAVGFPHHLTLSVPGASFLPPARLSFLLLSTLSFFLVSQQAAASLRFFLVHFHSRPCLSPSLISRPSSQINLQVTMVRLAVFAVFASALLGAVSAAPVRRAAFALQRCASYSLECTNGSSDPSLQLCAVPDL